MDKSKVQPDSSWSGCREVIGQTILMLIAVSLLPFMFYMAASEDRAQGIADMKEKMDWEVNNLSSSEGVELKPVKAYIDWSNSRLDPNSHMYGVLVLHLPTGEIQRTHVYEGYEKNCGINLGECSRKFRVMLMEYDQKIQGLTHPLD